MAKAPIGFGRESREGEDKAAVSRLFTPEFRNRLDAIIPFAHLSEDMVAKVVEKFVFKLESQLAGKAITIDLSEEAKAWLVNNGYDRPNGARPLARLISEKIKKPLADEVLFGKLTKGGEVLVIVKDDELAFKIKSSPKSKKSAAHEEEGELV